MAIAEHLVECDDHDIAQQIIIDDLKRQSPMKHGEWQEASLAFRAALKQRPDAYDYAWLADALDRLYKPEEATIMHRNGLMLTLQNDPPQQFLLTRR